MWYNDFDIVSTTYSGLGEKLKNEISKLQETIIIYSIQYYEFAEPTISDYRYDEKARNLVKLHCSENPELLAETKYWYCMKDFDSSTGFDLYSRLNTEDKKHLRQKALDLIAFFHEIT